MGAPAPEASIGMWMRPTPREGRGDERFLRPGLGLKLKKKVSSEPRKEGES